ncbi:MAG: hypothetical protein QGF49_07745 [Candidatus Marinimicrobia bacterium]|nr:hypothetical protein [Candidatus Neomarinimicrobiota bacterium]
MKKTVLLIIPLLFLFLSCEDKDKIDALCVKKRDTVINSKILRQYKCYENLYTEKECYALEGDGWYADYYTGWETCDDFCDYVVEEYTSDLIPVVQCN